MSSLANQVQRFGRKAKPVRYAALDPAHEAAIRNYLALATRAHGIPQLHRAATPVLNQQLGPKADLFHQMIQGLLGEHDPAALGIAQDLHEEQTGYPRIGPEHTIPYFENPPPVNDGIAEAHLRLLMAHLHHTLSGRVPGVDVPGMFGDEHMESDPVFDIVRGHRPSIAQHAAPLSRFSHPEGEPRNQLLDVLKMLAINPETGRVGHHGSMWSGNPRHLVTLADAAQSYTNSGLGGDPARRTVQTSQSALHDVLRHLTGGR